MKEYQSTTGGRHVYNSDFKNLQELALATQQIFAACGFNFVVSGCDCTVASDGTVTVSDGYAYINGKLRQVTGASSLSATNLYIIAKDKTGTSIPYADNQNHEQYIEYYATAENASSVTTSNVISYDSTNKTFPNLANKFFDFYAISKRSNTLQSIDKLQVTEEFTASKNLKANMGVTLASNYTVAKVTDGIAIKCENITFTFKKDGSISVSNASGTLFSFSNASGTGEVTYYNLTVTNELKTKNLKINGVDISTFGVPVGCVEMWAGPTSDDKIPSNYRLCDGRELSISDFQELYGVIGTTFNNAPRPDGTMYPGVDSTHFRLPDLRGRFIVGHNSADTDYSTLSKVGGAKNVKLTASQSGMPAHTHQVKDYYFASGGYDQSSSDGKAGKTIIDTALIGSGSTDRDNQDLYYYKHDTENVSAVAANDAHENRPPYYVLAYIIRVK